MEVTLEKAEPKSGLLYLNDDFYDTSGKIFIEANKMIGKQRLLAAIKGEKVDRVPIWIHGFPIGGQLPDKDHFTKGWMAKKEYKELFDEYQEYTEAWGGWCVGPKEYKEYSELGYINRFMCTAPKYIHWDKKEVSSNLQYYEGWINTPRKKLMFRNEIKRGEATFWRTTHIAKSIDDLLALAEAPFAFNGIQEGDLDYYYQAHKQVEDRGIVSMFISDPIATIATAIDFQDFLMFSLTESGIMHELFQEMTTRILKIVDAVFKNNKLDTIVTMGGSEEATPPMMSPKAFDEYIVPYSGQIIKRLKDYGILVHVHCHGRVKNVLKKIIEMGADSIDPVEPPPQGDVTYAQARKIVGNNLTLAGNIECSELMYESPIYIKNRIKEILSLGNKRLIITDSAPQISAFTQKMADNYRAMIETALKYGG